MHYNRSQGGWTDVSSPDRVLRNGRKYRQYRIQYDCMLHAIQADLSGYRTLLRVGLTTWARSSICGNSASKPKSAKTPSAPPPTGTSMGAPKRNGIWNRRTRTSRIGIWTDTGSI